MKHTVQQVKCFLPTPKLISVPLSEIVPAPYLLHTPAPVELAALAENIRIFGLLQPLGVRKIQSRLGRYELLFGYRRFLACRKLFLPSAPCLVFSTSAASSRFLSLSENLHRMPAPEIATAVATLGLSEEELCRKLSLSATPPPPAEKAPEKTHRPPPLPFHENAPKEPTPSPLFSKGVVRDARLIANSIDRTVAAGQNAGFPVEVQKIERASEICYHIRLPRTSAAAEEAPHLFSSDFPHAG